MSMNELVSAVKSAATDCQNGSINHSRPKLAARRMNISDATFWRKVKEGKIKVTKISERITVVAESEIQSVLAGERA